MDISVRRLILNIIMVQNKIYNNSIKILFSLVETNPLSIVCLVEKSDKFVPNESYFFCNTYINIAFDRTLCKVV